MSSVDPSNPRRLTFAWLALLALSGASAFAAQLSWPVIGLVFVLGLAFFKVRLVARDFMGLRGSNPTMLRALLCWCLVLALGALARTLVVSVAAG